MPSNWRKPLAWNREAEKAGERHRVFCASLADVFENWDGDIVDAKGKQLLRTDIQGRITMDYMRRELFALIDATPHLDWLLLTRRPENITKMWPRPNAPDGDPGRRNVWIGASVSDQETADDVIPKLWKCRDLAPVLWLSAEPLLGPIDLSRWIGVEEHMPGKWRCRTENGYDPLVDWIVVGGESGAGRREFDFQWARDMRDQCAARHGEVAYFFKQVDKVQPIPSDLMIRQSPAHLR